MIQALDKQLQVVIRALTDVVGPALATADRHVGEQLHLSVATLSFVLQRLPEARRYYRWELSAYLDLAEALGDDVALAAFRTDGAALLADPQADIADYEAATRRGREVIAAHAEQAGAAAAAVILARSGAIIDQQRRWCAPFGFELDPAALPAPAW